MTDTTTPTPAPALPHDAYMAAVADALEAVGMRPHNWWTETPDGQQLDAAFTDWPESAVNEDEWPHGVYLAWDQYKGRLLIESGGGRNITPLDPEGCGWAYTRPWQVAVSAANAIRGMGSTGPICTTTPWDGTDIETAVKAWQNNEDTAPILGNEAEPCGEGMCNCHCDGGHVCGCDCPRCPDCQQIPENCDCEDEG